MTGRIRDADAAFVHLARYVAQGAFREAAALIRRDMPAIGRERPDLDDLIRVAMAAASTGSLARGISLGSTPPPADRDSRLDLVREERDVSVAPELVWPVPIASALDGVVIERFKADELSRLGVAPTRTLLLVGAPGVGKTQAARYLAMRLGLPLLTLDLATVMSSLLGRTGNNLRAVLDYAQKHECVLLLDEFDAVAKRRDDASDVGELKRLVTVLLQAIDEWPLSGLLVAATNHPELLDPAVWRRFERVVRFPTPSVKELRQVIDRLVDGDVPAPLRALTAHVFEGGGFADVVKEINAAKRDSIVHEVTLNEALEARLRMHIAGQSRARRLSLAKRLAGQGTSQRLIGSITGIARDTLRTRGIATTRKT